MNTDNNPLLDAEAIQDLLTELGERLAQKGIKGRLFLVGGAAMALAINTRRSTRDLDAVFEPKSEIYAEAVKMADERGLPPDWLNDSVKGLLPDKVQALVGAHFETTGLSVEIASAEYLFAMKARAARDGVDTEDVAVLARHIGISSAEEAIELVESFYTPYHLKPATRYLLEELFQSDLHAPDLESEMTTGPQVGKSRSETTSRWVRPYRRRDGTVVRGYRRRN